MKKSGKNAPVEKNTAKNNKLKVKEENTVIRKKAPKWFYIAAYLIPVIFIIVLEVSLRLANYGDDYTQWIDAGQGKYMLNRDIGKKYFFSEGFVPSVSEDYFDIEKKQNSFRVFVLGGSSAEGYPFNPPGSFSRYIRKRLELTYPNTPVEVVNIAMTGVNSYTMMDLLPGVIKQKPDLVLIYAGHNEYYGALGVGSVQSFGSSRTVIRLMLFLNEFKTTQLVRNFISWVFKSVSSSDEKFSGTLMSKMPEDKNILMDSEVYNAGIEQFNDNLSDMLSILKDNNIPVILSRIASNLKDQPPLISAKTNDYPNADEIFSFAKEALKNGNRKKADSLFRLAKDLDALKFRAPEKINDVISDLGAKYNYPVIPVDSIFNSVSPDGIVGNNLMVDHLHPNLKGYQLIGKTFYETMNKFKFIPEYEKAVISFNKQDSLTLENFIFSRLDSVMGNYSVTLLKSNWPFAKKNLDLANFQHSDFINFFKPKDFIDSIAVFRIEGMSWSDAHLLAAKTYLLKDDIKNYLKHIDILLNQYPLLGDFNSLITYFYYRNKLDLNDYSTKRVGIIQFYRGKTDEAIGYLEKTYQYFPKDIQVLYYLSFSYFKKNNYEAALKKINECLSVKPDYSEAIKLKQEILKKI